MHPIDALLHPLDSAFIRSSCHPRIGSPLLTGLVALAGKMVGEERYPNM